MEEKMIMIPLDDYTDMVLMRGRYEAFENYIKAQKYDVSRTTIAGILGLELEEKKDA